MAGSMHQATLEAKHAELESLITSEMGRPLPDEQQIHLWKKQKLRLKDEMLRTEH